MAVSGLYMEWHAMTLNAMLARCLRLRYHYAADYYCRAIADKLGYAYSRLEVLK